MLDIRLKHLRKINNHTQQDIADLIGITRPAYTAYEQGVRNPDYTTLIKIADYYKVTTDFLLGRADENEDELVLATCYGRKVDILMHNLNNSKYLTLEKIPLSTKERETLLVSLEFGIELVKRMRKIHEPVEDTND
ncbi:helix-turn-helix domain-containing protein [Lysinibacillus fusiformis]|uniref:helix-turn-helix domain-containing protein n=1 Tax=Lysinibacillus fusiformis TaxID=28031 RepID=UPI00187EB918|nr:helix-turn-helix transcriptional regulator [Lysinibacillus fusiformis]MBD8523842.1 helix-turn-helix transcriptional regulator [Lysinibacillus fusiformis]